MGHEYRRCLLATSKHAYGPLQCSKLVKWPEYWGSMPLSSSLFPVPSKVSRSLVLKVVKLLQQAIPAPG